MILQSSRGLASITRISSLFASNLPVVEEASRLGTSIYSSSPHHSQSDDRGWLGPFHAFGGQHFRCATKKAGGTASQKQGSHAKNLGVKMLGGELIFPGQIIVRQRGLKYHPGYSVGLGRDHTIFATGAGFVHFHEETVVLGPDGQVPKRRMYVSIKPVDGNWDQQHRVELEAEMVTRRAAIKREMLRGKPFEPALFFSRRAAPGQPFSWLTRPHVRPLPLTISSGKGTAQLAAARKQAPLTE